MVSHRAPRSSRDVEHVGRVTTRQMQLITERQNHREDEVFPTYICVSARLMASARHAELLAPLPAPVPGQVKAFLSEFGGFALPQCPAASISLSPCLPGIQRAPSKCSSREFTLPFLSFQPRAAQILYARSRAQPSNATQMSCLHSFPHTPDTSSIFTWNNVHRIANKQS